MKNKSLMKIKKQLGLTIFIVIISTICIKAQPDGKYMINNQKEILSWLKEYNVPSVGIGIIKDGKLSECKVFGELRKGIPANDNAIFTIASLTKTIVSMVTLKLVEADQWDLDESLSDYWIDPDIKDDTRLEKLTTRFVLSHQSGFPNWRYETQSKKLIFNFEPGTKYQYSGEGFEYLRKALENKFHKSIEELSDSILFKPLNMIDTKYHWDKEVNKSRFAFRYDSEGKEYHEQEGNSANAAYGLLTTIEDYSKFGIDVMNYAGLSNELYNDMISTQVSIKKNIDQGLGWEIIRNLPNGEYALLHQGGAKGIETIVILLPVSKRGVIVFTNSDNGDKVYSKVIENFLDVGKNILRDYNQMSYNPEAIKIVNVSTNILSSYTGSYLIPSFQLIVNIILDDNTLKLQTPDVKMILYAETETKFFAKDDDLIIEFVKNENTTTGFILTFRGDKPEFSKKIEQ
jgi:CubicO group peptidase (beta-lactamase class C family)